MALQGTLETFSVPEVLRLLSSTRKSGLMALGGDRGMGKVWFDEGQIVAAESDQDKTGEINGVLFDLLRFNVGEFVFEPETAPTEASPPTEVETALDRAEALLAEWHELEAVVPSLDLGVRLRPEIDGPVTVTSDQWTSLVALGGGASAAGLGEALDLGELDTCRRIRDLVDADLVEITDEVPTSPADAPSAVEPAPEPEPVPEPAAGDDVDAPPASSNGSLRDAIRETVQGLDADTDDAAGAEHALGDHELSNDEVADLGNNLASFVAQPRPAEDEEPETEPASDEDVDLPEPAVDHEEADDPARDEPLAESTTADDGDTVDFMAQLSNLSPKAAAAIEATSDESGEHESGDTVALGESGAEGEAGDEAGDDEINRSLLLKFLSSTKN
ncbi:MAG: DUF4388 domain-containing protein [Acidimicrobiales bacterium]|nr:DUF4388 domain-containing protein [Acidimicrobiales bacterium]